MVVEIPVKKVFFNKASQVCKRVSFPDVEGLLFVPVRVPYFKLASEVLSACVMVPTSEGNGHVVVLSINDLLMR